MIYRTPHVHLNRHGEIVKLRWCPQNHGPPLIPEEDVLPYYEAVTRVGKLVNEDKEFQVCQRLEPGQVLTINNHRMLHGRNAIKLNGGVRHLNNFQINIDEFKSRLALLCAKYDPDYEPKNVFNHDFSFSGVAQTVHI
jgi:gamma-butyrobetaine dioxygenase